MGVAACSDRESEGQGNNGGKPVGVTSSTPQATGGTGSGAGAPPPSATSTVGTLPDQSTDPPTQTDNPQPGSDDLGDGGTGAGAGG